MPFSNKIKEIENNRNDSNINRIYLYKENGGWFIAYEWSAYLCEFFKNGLDEKNRLKPTKKLDSNKYPFIKVGFKLESIDKFLPETKYEEDDDGNLLVDVNLDNYSEYVMGIPYDELLEEWKGKVEIKESKKGNTSSDKDKNTTIYNQPIKFFTIMSDIIKYDYDNKNSDELKDFIKKLKNDCVTLIC